MLRRLGSLLIRRHVQTMASLHKAPAEPLVVVLGTTGAGKSELAVELATRFRGEIINADAMQLYHGLPIITGQMTPSEQRGIPHHLLGNISLGELPWAVDDFKREAQKVIREIRSRGNLPILVGGTQYYVDPLLFKDVILDEVQGDDTRSFPILEESTEILLQELKKVDPVMAERWHPNDRRKIQRSLEIYLQTGKPASEFYAEQQKRKAEAAQKDGGGQSWENLLFWVYSEREVLKERMGKRNDKMLDAGLLGEVQQLLAFKQERTAAGQTMDMTKGIWQSIGYKQFEPYALAVNEGKDVAELEELKRSGLEDMKTATRRYANYQTKWIRLKQIPLLLEQGPEAMNSLYLLNSTDVSQFQNNVVDPAAGLLAQFLRGEPRTAPTDMSDLAREVLTQVSKPPPKETPCQRTCELCQTVLVTEEAWARHIKGSGHRRVMKRKKKLALVPTEKAPEDTERPGSREGASSPDLATMFTS